MKNSALTALLAALLICSLPLNSTAQTAGGEAMGPPLPSGLKSATDSPALGTESGAASASPAKAADLGAAAPGASGGALNGPPSANTSAVGAQQSTASAPASSDSENHARTPAMRHVLTIEGMTCTESCPAKVRKALQSIKGVRGVEVDFEHKTAIVMTEEGAVLTKEICDKAFGNEGFFVSSLFSHPTTN